MTRKAIPQPVPTPAPVTFGMVREILNPTPQATQPPAIWHEWGYLTAMIDAVFAEFQETGDPDETVSEYDLIDLCHALTGYDGCDWHVLDWDEDNADAIARLSWKYDLND